MPSWQNRAGLPRFTDISMKNFSTVGVHALAAGLVASALLAPAIAAAQRPAKCEFRADAPDQHVVVKGDTLWDLSQTFLRNPWCWPDVWGMNRDEIRNPHWIYPGQIIYFDRERGRLSLTRPGSGSGADADADADAATRGLATTRMSPQLRTEGLGRDAIASIPSNVIEPFLTQPLIVEAGELKGAPRIVAAAEGHVFLGKDDRVYVRGELKGGTSFQVFRPGNPLKDPATGKLLAYEAVYLGTVKLFAEAKPGVDPDGGAHSFVVASSRQEMGVGDLLIPAPPTAIRNYVPHQPERPLEARIVSIYSGVSYAGQSQIVTVNKGSVDGLDPGAVLQLYNRGRTVVDRTADRGMFGLRSNTIKLPDEQTGSLMIFRVFKNVSYGLIMQVTSPVSVGDVAKSPE
jgi:nucleoid-associated protein YgaU